MLAILVRMQFWSRLIDFDDLAACWLIRDHHLALFACAYSPEKAL